VGAFAEMRWDYLTEYDRAVGFLAEKLNAGTLVLFLGAGVSSGAGLPEWRPLVEAMRVKVGLPNGDLTADADALERAANEIQREFYPDDEPGFAKLVQSCLYRETRLDDGVLGDRLLTSLGAMLMGGRRGSVKRVVTFNFDSVLESYIWLNGLVPKVVFQPPVDEGAEDVRLYHPHGFLPHPDLGIKGSDFVTFSSKAINLRIGEPYNIWVELLRHILSTGVGLFVGLSEESFRDRAIAPLLTAAGKLLNARRPTGIWILRNKSVNDSEVDKEFLDCNIVPLRVSEHADIPKLLLEVCQTAAQSVAVAG
jgi:hypothetical protein